MARATDICFFLWGAVKYYLFLAILPILLTIFTYRNTERILFFVFVLFFHGICEIKICRGFCN